MIKTIEVVLSLSSNYATLGQVVGLFQSLSSRNIVSLSLQAPLIEPKYPTKITKTERHDSAVELPRIPEHHSQRQLHLAKKPWTYVCGLISFRQHFLIFVLLGNTQFTEGACKYFLVLFAEAQATYGNDL